jgi:hypothetical protein
MISTITAICRRPQIATIQFTGGIAIAFLAIATLIVAPTALRAAPPLPGAIFTTDSTCSGVDLNIYGSKADVYLNGGPSHPGAASLPDGNYYVQVTDPSGACVLGTSVGASDPTPFKVVNGSVQGCIQLCSVLTNIGLDATCAGGGVADANCGYNNTPNSGGEYKVWVSSESSFTNNSTKTDNFKVKEGGGGPGGQATICVKKFYDANANGVQDNNEPNLPGWEYCVVGNNNFSALRFTFDPPRCLTVDPDDYCVTEGTPIESNWVHTTDTQACFTLPADGTQNVSFGNVCLGAGGGLTLGFWSNKNGQSLETAGDFTLLNSLCLRNADGSNKDFNQALSANKTALNTWLLGGTATNMAYMLSVQLAAMELNVNHFGVSNKFGAGVDPNAIVYAPCLLNFTPINGLSNLGFISISNLMAAANTALCNDGNTPAGDPNRAYQECLKNALDDANNNKNFTQSAANHCPYNFDTSDSCPFTNP